MDAAIEFSLTFDGDVAENHRIDLYDVSQALIGFQRSLAITTHLVINGEILTQSPSLKGATILSRPPEEGSWKFTAIILMGIFSATTAHRDTPFGHLIYSAYDYVISESLGFHVDYESSLGEQYEEHNKEINAPVAKQDQLDLIIEKCQMAIREIHRPIVKTKSATSAVIASNLGGKNRKVGRLMDIDTYKYLQEEFVSEKPGKIAGIITSYNSNTFKGRIYVDEEGRRLPFELFENCRSNQEVQLILESLSEYATIPHFRKLSMIPGREFDHYIYSKFGMIYCEVLENTSRTGKLKKYLIIKMSITPTGG